MDAALDSVTERLKQLRGEAARERAKVKRSTQKARPAGSRIGGIDRARLRDLAWLAGRIAFAAALPFVTLVGGSAWAYRLLGLPTWAALAFAAVLTALCLTAYGVRLAKALGARYRGRRIGMRLGMRVALPIVAVYCAYALLFLARENAKTDAVRSYFTSVHPLLRLALRTAVIADPRIVLTETARRPEDYRAMGLRQAERSLHFRQRDGYVHAVDLRTTGRSWITNAATRAWFGLMGFQTLRHVGTADHLHVALPLR